MHILDLLSFLLAFRQVISCSFHCAELFVDFIEKGFCQRVLGLGVLIEYHWWLVLIVVSLDHLKHN